MKGETLEAKKGTVSVGKSHARLIPCRSLERKAPTSGGGVRSGVSKYRSSSHIPTKSKIIIKILRVDNGYIVEAEGATHAEYKVFDNKVKFFRYIGQALK